MTVTVSVNIYDCDCVRIYKSPVNMTVSINIYDCDCVYEHLWLCLYLQPRQLQRLQRVYQAPVTVSASTKYLWLTVFSSTCNCVCIYSLCNCNVRSARTKHLWLCLHLQITCEHDCVYKHFQCILKMFGSPCTFDMHKNIFQTQLGLPVLHARQPYKEVWWHCANWCELHDLVAIYGKITLSHQ